MLTSSRNHVWSMGLSSAHEIIDNGSSTAGDAQVQFCPLCCRPMRTWKTGLYDDRYGCAGLYSLLQCRCCGLMETWPQPRNEELPALYAAYYSRDTIDIEALPGLVSAPHTRTGRMKLWITGTLNQGHFFARPGMKVLDYGCGAAVSLMEITRMGAEAYGIEVDPNVKRVAERFGLKVHVGTLDDDPFPEVKFDLISLNQVIEHVPQPAALLADLAKRLEDGGVVVLSFPNTGSLYRRLFGRRWINWHVPYHLHHFDRRSFSELCRRAGWRLERWTTATPNVWTAVQLKVLLCPTPRETRSRLWMTRTRAGNHDVRAQNRTIGGLARRCMRTGVRLLVALAITLANRLVDLAGLGDSALVVIKPSARVDGTRQCESTA